MHHRLGGPVPGIAARRLSLRCEPGNSLARRGDSGSLNPHQHARPERRAEEGWNYLLDGTPPPARLSHSPRKSFILFSFHTCWRGEIIDSMGLAARSLIWLWLRYRH